MQKINCGIIGCGVIAPTHIESYQAIPDVQVAWVCDIVPEKASQLAQRYRIPQQTADYRQILKDPQVTCISVCTDHVSHEQIVLDCLSAGKHVLCEKPLGITMAQLDNMVNAARAHPELVCETVFQHRFDPSYSYVKDLVDARAFGKILTAGMQARCLRTDAYYRTETWRGTWAREGGGVLINQTIHLLDIYTWALGGISSISAVWDNFSHKDSIETEDTLTAAVRLKNGALGTIEVTSASNLDWELTLSIHGTAGSLDLRDGAVLRLALNDPALQQQAADKFAACKSEGAAILGKHYYGPSHPAQLADFIDAIRTRRAPFISFESARQTVDVVLAAYRSHKEKQWVSVALQNQ
jgi:UDP-N-acetyl-2-amino-2-deoxyglucuronate dehydrogenase